MALSLVALGCSSARQDLAGDAATAPPGSGGAGPAPAGAGGNTAGDAPGADASPPAGRDAASPGDTRSAAPPPPGQHRLQVTVVGPGQLDVMGQAIDCSSGCTIDRPAGTALTLTPRAQPAPNDTLFVGWSGACTGTATCAVTLDADRAVTATFHRFLLWEQPLPMQATLTVEANALWAGFSFTSSITIGGRTFTSAGGSDALLARYDLQGTFAWAKAIQGIDHDTIGRVVPAAIPTDVGLPGWSGASAQYDGQALPAGYYLATIGPGGELRSVAPAKSSPLRVRFGNGDVTVDYGAAPGDPVRLVRYDASGRTLWSKDVLYPDGTFFSAEICDAAGSVVVGHSMQGPVVVAGKTITPAAERAQLLLKYSPDGEIVWVTQVAAALASASIRCDAAGDAYAFISWLGLLHLDDRTQLSQFTSFDVGVAKLAGATGKSQWLTTFGSDLPDNINTSVFAADHLLVVPRFLAPAKVAGETFPASTPIIRLDPATGAVRHAFDPGRKIGELVRPSAQAPAGDYFFVGPTSLGRLILPSSPSSP